MAQSNLYNSSNTADVVDVTTDDARDIGDVDVKTVQGAVDISDRDARNLGEVDIPNTVPTDLQYIDPITGSTTTAGTNVTLLLGDYRKTVNFWVDTSGSATFTVEVRIANGTWFQLDQINYSSAVSQVESYTTAFEEVRARVDSSLNNLVGISKGV